MPSQLKLAQISDCHLFADPHKVAYGINPNYTLLHVLTAIAASGADMLLVTGDISGDETEQSYERFWQAFRQSGLSIPVVSVAGNHDAITLWQNSFATEHRYQSLVLPVDNWHLHLLPAQFKGTQAILDDSIVAQFEAAVAIAPDVSHLLALHHPLWQEGVWMDKHAMQNPERLLSILAEATNVKAVLHGHVHTARDRLCNSVHVLACPSTCWQWGNTPDFSVAQLGPGYRMLTLNESGDWNSDVTYLPIPS